MDPLKVIRGKPPAKISADGNITWFEIIRTEHSTAFLPDDKIGIKRFVIVLTDSSPDAAYTAKEGYNVTEDEFVEWMNTFQLIKEKAE